jgi:hypothetical protein
MRLKSELYRTEREQLEASLESIFSLREQNVFILHELDHNVELQNQIMRLVPEIRKYYNCNNIKAVSEPSRIKRPWLSIVKTILKPHYTISSKDYHFTREGKHIHSQKYTFSKKCCVPDSKNSENDSSETHNAIADLKDDPEYSEWLAKFDADAKLLEDEENAESPKKKEGSPTSILDIRMN